MSQERVHAEQDQIQIYRRSIEAFIDEMNDEWLTEAKRISTEQQKAVLNLLPDEIIPLLRPGLFQIQFATEEAPRYINDFSSEKEMKRWEESNRISKILDNIHDGSYRITRGDTAVVISGTSTSGTSTHDTMNLLLENAFSDPDRYEVIDKIDTFSFWAIRAKK